MKNLNGGGRSMPVKKRFAVIAVVALALVCLAFASCIIESERPVIRGPWLNQQGAPITGFIDVQTRGYMGGQIFVNLWLNEYGRIGSVEFDISSDTQRFVAPLPGAITPMILLTNSFNFPVTVVSGATGTAINLVNAVRDAFIELGVNEADVGF